jgi:hypothetical protein
MTNNQTLVVSHAEVVGLAEAEALLERFPDVGEEQVRRIASFIRNGSSLDVGILSANTSAWEKAERLRAERPDLFRTSAKGWLLIAGTAIVSVAMLYSLWAIAPQ